MSHSGFVGLVGHPASAVRRSREDPLPRNTVSLWSRGNTREYTGIWGTPQLQRTSCESVGRCDVVIWGRATRLTKEEVKNYQC